MVQIFGITGSSSSGKTTVCKRINEELGLTVISLDDFFKNIDDYVRHPNGDIDFDHPDNILWDELFACLKQLSRGEDTLIPVYKKGFGPNTGRLGHTKITPTNKLIIEGYLLFAIPEKVEILQEYIPLHARIFLDVPKEVQRERRAEAYDGFDNPDEFEKVYKVFEKLILPSKVHVGNIVDAARSRDEVFAAVKKILEQKV